MTLGIRRFLLLASSAVGSFVGLWAAAAPRSFYDSFPGLGHIWVAVDGPYNEHLIRDVGALYLALVAAGLVAAWVRDPHASLVCGRAVGAAWIVFSLPHLLYHSTHLHGFSAGEAVLVILALLVNIVLAIPLLIGDRSTRTAPG